MPASLKCTAAVTGRHRTPQAALACPACRVKMTAALGMSDAAIAPPRFSRRARYEALSARSRGQTSSNEVEPPTADELLTLASSILPGDRALAASQEECPPELLAELLRDSVRSVAENAASNPSTPPEALGEALGDPDFRSDFGTAPKGRLGAAGQCALKNPSCPVDLVIEWSRNNDDRDAQQACAANPILPEADFSRLFRRGDDSLDRTMLANPSCPSDFFHYVMQKSGATAEVLQDHALRNPSCPPEILREIMTEAYEEGPSAYRTYNPARFTAVITNPSCPVEEPWQMILESNHGLNPEIVEAVNAKAHAVFDRLGIARSNFEAQRAVTKSHPRWSELEPSSPEVALSLTMHPNT